jgi:hypothetical protein
MAYTTGLVHEITWSSDAPNACIRVGPSPADTEALIVLLEGNDTERAYQTNMIDALGRAMLARREVGVWHEDDSSRITSINLEAA